MSLLPHKKDQILLKDSLFALQQLVLFLFNYIYLM